MSAGADAGDGDGGGARETRGERGIDDGDEDQRELGARSRHQNSVLIQPCQSPMRRKV